MSDSNQTDSDADANVEKSEVAISKALKEFLAYSVEIGAGTGEDGQVTVDRARDLWSEFFIWADDRVIQFKKYQSQGDRTDEPTAEDGA